MSNQSSTETNTPASVGWGPDHLVRDRRSIVGSDSTPPFDLIVVGAGITGAGVARDAALRGMKVLVLDAGDIGCGTSSRSSRLVHGGVRYLEQGDLALVFEAVRERQLLVDLAPHLVRPHRFILTSYRGDRVGPTRLRLGLSLYDALSMWRARRHQYLTPEHACTIEPSLNATNLRGAVMYEDAVTDDFRLTLSVLDDARSVGARVITYSPVSAIRGRPEAYEVELATGGYAKARAVVVATGPWTGPRLLGEAGRNLLALSKGIHLTFRATDLSVNHPLVFQVPGGRRLMFVVPWGSRTYLGTTDDPFDGDPSSAGATPREEHELLATASRWLPHAALRPDRIVSAWAGVRPLVRAPSIDSTIELSRSHRIVENSIGVLGIVGGKLTTYRAMAAEVVDRVTEIISAPNGSSWSNSSTDSRPVVAGEPLTERELADPLLRDLVARHGPRSRLLATLAGRHPDLSRRIVDDLPYRWVELRHAVDEEGASHLDDVLRRRVPLALADAQLGASVARTVATWIVDRVGGRARDIEAELERYASLVHRETGRELSLRNGPSSTRPHAVGG